MISNFKKPDLNKPRYREKVLSLLNVDTLEKFKEKYPMYSSVSNDKLKKVIKSFNGKVWEGVIDNRNGIELPESLGYLFIGSCPPSKKVNMNYALSKQYGKVIENKNWETDGYIGKIFYTNYSPRYKFKTRELWQFNAIRQFKRSVASVYPTKWRTYISVPNKFRVADMYKKDK
tara:strand:+ start:13261 stop:13782 length:522 start_codon:yes stop_codon:yes gene_type:complete